MLIAELDCMGWSAQTLVQVPNLEVFVLVYCKEFTDSGSKAGCVVSEVLRTLKLLSKLFISHDFCVIEIEKAPFDLSYGVVCLVIPDCNRSGVIFIEESREAESQIKIEVTYVIEPQEYAARRRPLSDIDMAVGEFRPIVSIFTGVWSTCVLSILNSPSEVEKKKIYGSAGSNSISML